MRKKPMGSRHDVQFPAKQPDAVALPVELQPYESAHDLAGETAVVSMAELAGTAPEQHVLVFTVTVYDASGVPVGKPIEHRHSVSDAALADDPDLLATLMDEIRDKALKRAENARLAAAQFARVALATVEPRPSVEAVRLA